MSPGPTQTLRPRSRRSLREFDEEELLPVALERFIFPEVREAFQVLEPEPKDIAWTMYRYALGVALDALDRRLRPVETRHGEGPGPYCVWRRFAQLGGAQMVCVHPLNDNPAWILDFAVPGSARTRMSKATSLIAANSELPD